MSKESPTTPKEGIQRQFIPETEFVDLNKGEQRFWKFSVPETGLRGCPTYERART